jgi:hypothetical protein
LQDATTSAAIGPAMRGLAGALRIPQQRLLAA